MGITKKNKTFMDISPNPIPVGVRVAPAKLSDVQNLLQKHYGDDWREIEFLSYYKNVIDGQDHCNRAEMPRDGEDCENATSLEDDFI